MKFNISYIEKESPCMWGLKNVQTF